MAFEIGGGIIIGGGITIEIQQVLDIINNISTELSQPILTESSNNLVTEDSFVPTAPNPTSASPTSGPNAGGTSVVLSGSGFTGTTSMAIAYPGFVSNNVTSFVVNNDTQITFTSPNNGYVPGSGYVIRVTNPLGTGELSGWTYT